VSLLKWEVICDATILLLKVTNLSTTLKMISATFFCQGQEDVGGSFFLY